MFGYVKIYKPRLTCGDFELYRGVYCSLCKTLGRRYGPFAQLTLNYDMTFYALLALSAREQKPAFVTGCCSYNPAKKCLRTKAAALDFVADVSMLMVYYQWRDKLEDGSFWGKLLWAVPGLFFLWAGRRAKKRAPQAERIIRTAVTAQRLAETAPEAYRTPDPYAHPSAFALGALCELLEPQLRGMGYLVGRWVYLADAADDMEDDAKHGQFNAFARCGGDRWEALYATQAQLQRTWQEIAKLPIFDRFRAIFDNIITLGLAHTQDMMMNARGSMKQEGSADHEEPI